MEKFSSAEIKILKSLKTPRQIQDFINSLRVNFDKGNDSCQSPKSVLRSRKAHCIEAAMLAACALRFNGWPPLVLDLESTRDDDDHVIVIFKQFGCFGAISKSNHAVLRYREPIYKTIRELVLSYFHEYVDSQGRKTLRKFSRPVNLARFDREGWMTNNEDVWHVAEYLAKVKHYPILNSRQIRNLRLADPIERKLDGLVEFRKKR